MSISSFSLSRYCSSMTSSTSSSSSTSTSTSSKASPPSHPIAIGFTPGGTDALMDLISGYSSSISSQASACAFPSWPKKGASLQSPPECNHGSSYISDEDLFGLDDDDLDGSLPFLSEAPAPPREAHEYEFLAPVNCRRAAPLLPPVLPTMSARPKVRRSPVKKSALRRTPKGLPCIRESGI